MASPVLPPDPSFRAYACGFLEAVLSHDPRFWQVTSTTHEVGFKLSTVPNLRFTLTVRVDDDPDDPF